MPSRWLTGIATALILLGSEIAASADPGANPPQSPWIENRSGGWMNVLTHVYDEPHQYLGTDGVIYQVGPEVPYQNGAYWMFSAARLRVKVTALSSETLASQLRGTLPATWHSATRGLGTIEIADAGVDVEVFALAGEGISYHSVEWVQGVPVNHQFVYETNRGVAFDRNVDAALVATHEIAHIWCCYTTSGTDKTGHWYTAGIPTPGIMNDHWYVDFPGVDWTTFTDRELATMGLLRK